MVLYFASRNAARALSAGKLVDNGPDAPKGERYGRAFAGIGGNSRQRRQSLRAILRTS